MVVIRQVKEGGRRDSCPFLPLLTLGSINSPALWKRGLSLCTLDRLSPVPLLNLLCRCHTVTAPSSRRRRVVACGGLMRQVNSRSCGVEGLMYRHSNTGNGIRDGIRHWIRFVVLMNFMSNGQGKEIYEASVNQLEGYLYGFLISKSEFKNMNLEITP